MSLLETLTWGFMAPQAGFEPEREVASFSRFSDNLSLKIW